MRRLPLDSCSLMNPLRSSSIRLEEAAAAAAGPLGVEGRGAQSPAPVPFADEAVPGNLHIVRKHLVEAVDPGHAHDG